MAIAFNCPHCGEAHRVKDELAGKTGKCKNAECRKPILIPFKSTVPQNGVPAPVGPVDAEQLAAAAFSEEPPPPPKETGPTAKIAVECNFCGTKFEVDASMAGKNSRCPECGKIVRVPVPKGDKPVDWRNTNEGRPSLAKSQEPAPEGAWDTQRKGVGGEAIRKAGAHEVEEPEEPSERRIRRIKQSLYALAFLSTITLAVVFFIRSRTERKQEKWMEQAVHEIEDKNDGSKRPEYLAAVHRYALEYFVRAAKKREDLDAAVKYYDKALSEAQAATDSPTDRNALLIEVGLAAIICGGEGKELDEERRLPWDKVHPKIRQAFDKLPADRTLRHRAYRLLTRKLVEKEQGLLTLTIAKNACSPEDYPEIASRIGIEFLLLGKNDLAEHVLAKTNGNGKPEWTALWLALNPGKDQEPDGKPNVPLPGKGIGRRDTRLAYSEGYALQGRLDIAGNIAGAPGPSGDRIEALLLVAGIAVDTGKMSEAGPLLDALAALVLAKDQQTPAWQMHRIVELCAKANKLDKAQLALDATKDAAMRSWSRLEMLRVRIAALGKQKADEQGVEALSDPYGATPPPACIGRAEVARHNALVGESAYAKTIEVWPKGTIRPFGYAGTALGNQDKSMK